MKPKKQKAPKRKKCTNGDHYYERDYIDARCKTCGEHQGP